MTDGGRPRRRGQRAAARRKQILDAAAVVFSAKGYHGASIRDISETAGVADGTVYNYFENKDSLLLAMLEAIIQVENMDRELGPTLVSSWEDALRLFFRQHFAKVADHYALFRAIIPELLATPALRTRYYDELVRPAMDTAERYLREQIALGNVRPVEPELGSRMLSAIFLGVLSLRVMDDPALQPDPARDAALADALTDLFVRGWR